MGVPEAARRRTAGSRCPGDPNFPDWIDQKLQDGHLTETEWLERPEERRCASGCRERTATQRRRVRPAARSHERHDFGSLGTRPPSRLPAVRPEGRACSVPSLGDQETLELWRVNGPGTGGGGASNPYRRPDPRRKVTGASNPVPRRRRCQLNSVDGRAVAAQHRLPRGATKPDANGLASGFPTKTSGQGVRRPEGGRGDAEFGRRYATADSGRSGSAGRRDVLRTR